MSKLKYPDNSRLAHITKEAVASAILQQTYNSLRGAGPQGQIIYREKPAKVLHTQFLLPRRKPSTTAASYFEKEDVSSPAHIGTIGLTFQIANRHDRTIAISIRACIYVRILPSTADLAERPLVFRLSKQARRVILRHRRDALRRAEEQNKAVLGNEGRKSPAWLDIKNGATEAAENAALVELGISPASLKNVEKKDSVVSILAERDEEPADDDPTVGVEATTNDGSEPDTVADDGDPTGAAIEIERPASRRDATPSGDSDTLKAFEFVVRPGGTNAPPEILIEREQIPQKWLRVPVDLGTLQIDLAKDEVSIAQTVADFNGRMQRRIDEVVDAWEKDSNPETGGLLWAFPAGGGMRSRTITPSEVLAWDNTLTVLRTNRRVARPRILPVLEFENLEDPLHPDERTIRIILANESDLIDSKQAEARECDCSLYQVELSVQFPPDLHRPISLERIAPSYRYNRYLTHDALGINCGIRRRRLVDPYVLETTALPIYCQPLIKQFEISPAPEFARLAEADGGLEVLQQLLSAYDDWLETVIASKPFESALDPVLQARDYAREKQQFESVDLPQWQAERNAMARGVQIIEHAVRARQSGKPQDHVEVIPLTAWRFMNQTFREFWQRRNKTVTQWRLFQLAFIVAQIPAIVSRLDYWSSNPLAFSEGDEREAALLYFSTGGGKSESFFGLLVFSLAFDRLRGKRRGITALVRYPLRLLTSQQAYRLSQVLAAAQRVRWSWNEHGYDLSGHPFEIGFWVGGNNTPNSQHARGVSDIPRLQESWDELPLRRGNYAVYLKKWSRLPSCPFCNGTLQDGDKKYSSVGLRRFSDGLEERLAHLCFNRECDWNRKHGAKHNPHPLPIHVMDTDIYAYAPCVLLGTVDKLALIGQSSRTIARVLGMFGFAAWHHTVSDRLFSPYTREQFGKGPQASGCEPVFPFYSSGKQLFFDPYPLLEVQDEAHLLDESLGTFSGLFETTFQHALRTLAPLHGTNVVSANGKVRAPRIVAASATVTHPARQIDQIYQRSVVLFPQPGPDLYESFYARLSDPASNDAVRNGSANAEHRTPTRRRYVSLMTNGRTHTAATVAVLSAFHLRITQLLRSLIEGDDAARWLVRKQMAEALPDDIFQAGHRDALLDPQTDHAQIAGIINLNRIALLYVTNKKGGDNVKAALQDVVRRDHRLAGFDVPGVKTELITGAIDAGLIGAIVTEATSIPSAGTDFSMEQIQDSLRCVIATSAISHGVDVDEFNMMFFAGQPADIAEYIQASSRIGRAHVGTSILIPTPQQRRDRYIVEIHDIFHRFLERMIDAAPVERWAENAINRTLASFLQLKLCGVDYIKKMNAAGTDADRSALAEPDKVGEIGDRSRSDHINLLDELRKFVTDGIGLYHATSPINKTFYEQRIQDLFDQATSAMEQSNWRTETLDMFFRQPGCALSRPMTSLRDVNDAGLIEGGYGTGSDRIKRSDLGRVMSALMKGNNNWAAGEAGE
jgi:Helicase conserved C-terminal domain